MTARNKYGCVPIMPWLLLTLWCTFLLGSFVDCIMLPPIHWNQSNPMFKTSNNDHIVEVNINDEIDFICPHTTERGEGRSEGRGDGRGEDRVDINNQEFYIVYQVTKDEYDSCMLYSGKRKNLVVNCSTPKQRKRYTIIFERYSSIPNGQEYMAGGAYYFITTSTGQLDGLDNPHEGACLYSNMKLTIKVCCETTTTSPSDLTSPMRNQSSPLPTVPTPIPTSPDPLPPHRTPSPPSPATPTPARPQPQHTTMLPPSATTTTLPTTTTTWSTSKPRRTTPTTRTRWKYPTTDKFPSTKHQGKKDEEDNDYNHENEVLPNKEQLVNAVSAVRSYMLTMVLLTLFTIWRTLR